MGAVSDICDLIRHRKAIYAAALQGDLARLRTVHGAGLIDECLRTIAEDEQLQQQRRPPPPPPSRLVPRRRYRLGGR
jgi:hypothetical protein